MLSSFRPIHSKASSALIDSSYSQETRSDVPSLDSLLDMSDHPSLYAPLNDIPAVIHSQEEETRISGELDKLNEEIAKVRACVRFCIVS